MLRVRLKGIAAPLLIAALLLGACGSQDAHIAAVQQTIVRDIANIGGTGSRQDLPLTEFLQNEFAGASPTLSWATAALPKDDPDVAAMIGVNAIVTPEKEGFPKVTLRFKYDPATKRVAYRDILLGKKPLADKYGRKVLLAGAYEALKARADAAIAKAKKKKAKKDKVAQGPVPAAGIGRA